MRVEKEELEKWGKNHKFPMCQLWVVKSDRIFHPRFGKGITHQPMSSATWEPLQSGNFQKAIQPHPEGLSSFLSLQLPTTVDENR